MAFTEDQSSEAFVPYVSGDTLMGSELVANGKPLGRVEDCLLDDIWWRPRYLLVRRTSDGVLLLVSAFDVSMFGFGASRSRLVIDEREAMELPKIDFPPVIDRDQEVKWCQKFNWPRYWEGSRWPQILTPREEFLSFLRGNRYPIEIQEVLRRRSKKSKVGLKPFSSMRGLEVFCGARKLGKFIDVDFDLFAKQPSFCVVRGDRKTGFEGDRLVPMILLSGLNTELSRIHLMVPSKVFNKGYLMGDIEIPKDLQKVVSYYFDALYDLEFRARSLFSDKSYG